MTQPTHEDPFAEVRGQAAQALAVAATVGEAAARWYAVGLQNRAQRTERDNAAANAQTAADRLATNATNSRAATDGADTQDQQLIDKGLTDWINQASMEETLRVWRTATIHAAAGDRRAADAAARAQQRLRDLNKPFMDAYDQRRRAGMAPAEAMRAAAYDLWDAYTARPPARPHAGREYEPLSPGANGKTLAAGGPALDQLDAAVRDEVGRLAAHISPEALDKLQREWRADGRGPAADAAGLLHQFATDAVRRGLMPATAADGLHAAATAGIDDSVGVTAVARDDVEATNPGVADVGNGSAVAQRLTTDAADEQRAAAIDSSTPDAPSTPRVDEQHDAQERAEVHLDHAAADRAAAAHQQQLMRHAFPPLTAVTAHPAAEHRHQPQSTGRSPQTRRTR